MSLMPVNSPSMETFTNIFQSLPPLVVDTEGGTVMDVQEQEEIDPDDGCNVQVVTYQILSADGKEEMIRTIRRKLKLECTVAQKMITQSSNEHRPPEVLSKVEKFIGDMDGIRTNTGPSTVQDQCEDRLVLNHHPQQDQFWQLLNDQKNQFQTAFPDLFINQKKLLPPTDTEMVVNPDGSTTIRTSSSKAFSSRFMRKETFVDGVKQESSLKLRAFVQYCGPDGGFRVKIADGEQEEASEDEDDDDRSIASSEIQENDMVSSMVFTQASGLPKLDPKGKLKKRIEKAWHAVKELVDTEQRYVDKLRLLDETFRERVEKENQKTRLFEGKHLGRIFTNITTLYRFHNNHLLPQLIDRLREWQQVHRMGDVMRKQAPFLKLYSEYSTNYKQAIMEFELCLKKNKRFALLVQEIEHLPECENLPLCSHLICPVQRIMRYQLLLQEYLKNLDKEDGDYEDTRVALELVLDAASHANEIMKKLDRHKNVLEVQELLGNQVSLVSPSRELIKQGCIMKLSKTNRAEERYLFLFNDMLLLCSLRNAIVFAKYRLRVVFDAAHMQVCQGDNFEKEHSFYVRGPDSESAPFRCVELYANNSDEKNHWIDHLWKVISNARIRRQSFAALSGSLIKTTHPIGDNTLLEMCNHCSTTFGWLNRSTRCDLCSSTMCKKCCRKTKRNRTGKTSRVCGKCLNEQMSRKKGGVMEVKTGKRVDMLTVSCTGPEVVFNGHVLLRSSTNKAGIGRFFAVRNDFCLYSFRRDTDSMALTMLPMPGCEVKMDSEKLCFRIKHLNRVYTVETPSQVEQAKWMAVLQLASSASLPA